jgi:hypothetical protein
VPCRYRRRGARLPSGEELLLVVTTAGRGVMSARGEKVARDRTERDGWHDEYALTAEGIVRSPASGPGRPGCTVADNRAARAR